MPLELAPENISLPDRYFRDFKEITTLVGRFVPPAAPAFWVIVEHINDR